MSPSVTQFLLLDQLVSWRYGNVYFDLILVAGQVFQLMEKKNVMDFHPKNILL